MRVVGSTELESVTSCVSSRRSNQLSYEPATLPPGTLRESGVNGHPIEEPAVFSSATLPCQSSESETPQRIPFISLRKGVLETIRILPVCDMNRSVMDGGLCHAPP